MFLPRCALVLLLCVVHIQCARILGVSNTPSISHQVVFQPIWRELSLRGHEVVVITPNPLKEPSLVNLTEVDMGFLYRNMELLMQNASQGVGHWEMTERLISFCTLMTEDLFAHSEVLKIINDNTTKFDVVLAEAVMPTLFAFATKLGCPLVGVTSQNVLEQLHSAMGTPRHPVLYPDLMTDFGENLSFMRRVDAVLFDLYMKYIYTYKLIPEMDKLIRRYFGEDMPGLLEIEKNVSILLLNTNPVLHRPRPFGPNVIEIGGRMHLKPNKSLPADLQEYLDNASQAVIYFSLGSNIKSKFLEESKRQSIVEAFSELPYKILWKFENDELEDKPDNVRISKWLPQQDLLHHPNIKLFITQGGLQSLEEAVTKGIPFLVIPFFGDQFLNAQRIERLGFGLQLNYKDLNKDNFKSAILELINNPRYTEKAQKIGKLLQDEAMTGLQKAVWWIEYVIRNNGAPHLRSPVVDIPWHEYYLLDVYLFFIGLCLGISYVIYRMVVFIVRFKYFASKKRKRS